jgi:CHAT domain-containing protein
LVDSFVISPVYAPPLSFAQDEAKLVKDSFAGEIITPANFDNIEKNLGSQGKSLVHFCCHGEDQETLIAAIGSRNEDEHDKRTRSRVQIIRLENGQTLNSTQILGMAGVDTIFEQKHPLVFLNACEVGRGIPALLGVGGFAKSFLDLRASAVIAPLWSVKDTIAHEIAETFYKRVKAEPNTPFAEILRDLRRKAYAPGEAQDTYAAYCFYGDPGASRASDG